MTEKVFSFCILMLIRSYAFLKLFELDINGFAFKGFVNKYYVFLNSVLVYLLFN